MVDAKILYHNRMRFHEGRFEVRINAYAVLDNKKFPDGVKLSCVLLDLSRKEPILLMDNHQPYGYHMHTKMPHDKPHRVIVNVQNFEEAIKFFMIEAKRVCNEKV